MVRSHPRERTAAADRESGRRTARHDDLPRSRHHQAGQQAHQSPGVESKSKAAGEGARPTHRPDNTKGRLFSRPSHKPKNQNYFLGAIASLVALATRNFTTVLALIWMGSPVCGLRPMRALRCAFTKRPRPGTTNTPFFLVSLIAVSARFSRNAAAVLLFAPTFSAR